MPEASVCRRRRNAALVILALILPLVIAAGPAHAREDISRVLTFEAPGTLERLHPPVPETISLDSTMVREGRYSLRIQRDSTSREAFSHVWLRIPVDFAGDTVEVRGWLRWRGVTGEVGLIQRQDGPDGPVGFDNMHERNLHGDSEWIELSSKVRLGHGANRIHIGALLGGAGTLWVDDIRVFVDGVPLAQVPVLEKAKTVIDTDHAFDAGSGFALERVSDVQAENLALLGRVWGFLKYHHPAVVHGQRHWDYDLFRILPAVASARSGDACRRVLVAWIDTLPPVPLPDTLATLPPDSSLALKPDLAWMSDARVVGDTLGARLRMIYMRRLRVREQFFVYPGRPGNFPTYDHEATYDSLDTPDAGFRLLALFRFWNVVEWWHPDRALIGEDWGGVLHEFVPRALAAKSHLEYARCMVALGARVHDGHMGFSNAPEAVPPTGGWCAPIHLRFIANHAVVAGWSEPRLGPASGLRVGDVVTHVDGVAVETLAKRWRPFYSYSNEAAFRRDVAISLTSGDSGEVRIVVDRGGHEHEYRVARVRQDQLPDLGDAWRHDLPGPTLRRASKDLVYLAFCRAKNDSVEAYVARMAGAMCLIVDLRNYPEQGVQHPLGAHLVSLPTVSVTFSLPDYSNPGAFTFGPSYRLRPAAPRFEGRVEILVDEVTQSAAEFAAQMLRTCPNARVVGSTTAGADGNVVSVVLPGGLSTDYSSIGVYTPDHRNTQRVGIVPDIVATPTNAGLVAGRDEVLEAAVRDGLGREITASEREALRPRPNPEASAH
jgi:Peptidase family S41